MSDMGGHARAIETLVETALSSRDFISDFERVFDSVVFSLEHTYRTWLQPTGSDSPSPPVLPLLILS